MSAAPSAAGSGGPPAVLGVVGAGTMGAGIAQLGCAAGMTVLLHDPLEEALERGAERVRSGLRKWIEKGRAGEDSLELLRPAAGLGDLAGCELVIEAAPERAELKRELFASLSKACGPETVLATNTSSIPVTSLAGAADRPENVVGMHFFNPPPLMKLLEVIRADQTGERALEVARTAGEAMGKQVILAADGPGFLVNRCGRPFNGEALRLLQEGVASHEQIDRICRMGGGFRMGPFELMDLVGVDVGYAVAKSFTELSFGEPRWKPSPIQARMVAAGRLGRKTGRGYYDYTGEGPYRPEDPEPAAAGAAGALGSAAAPETRPLRPPQPKTRPPRAPSSPSSATAPSRTAFASALAPPATSSARAVRPSSSWTLGSIRPARLPAAPLCSCSAPAAASPPGASPAPSASTCSRRSANRGSSS